MATLSAVKITESGITNSLEDCAAAGDEFVNSGIEIIRIQNTHASAVYSIKLKVQTTSYRNPQYGSLTKSDIYKVIAAPGSSQETPSSAMFGPNDKLSNTSLNIVFDITSLFKFVLSITSYVSFDFTTLLSVFSKLIFIISPIIII